MIPRPPGSASARAGGAARRLGRRWFPLSLAAVLGASLAGPASADQHQNERDRYRLELAEGWVPTSLEATWRRENPEQTLIIRRFALSNQDAWRGRERHFDAVESGLAKQATDYRRLQRRIGKAGRVPTLDLWFTHRRADGRRTWVAMRFLFFRRYAVSLAVETPAEQLRAQRRDVRRLLRSFQPYFATDSE